MVDVPVLGSELINQPSYDIAVSAIPVDLHHQVLSLGQIVGNTDTDTFRTLINQCNTPLNNGYISLYSQRSLN